MGGVSRSIEKAIRSGEISIVARLASITVAVAISRDPRLYKSDTLSSQSFPFKRKDMGAYDVVSEISVKFLP